MSSNFEWQKQQANERVQSRLKEAEIHRLAKENRRGRSPWRNSMIAGARRFWSRFKRRLDSRRPQTTPTQDAVKRRERLT